MVIGSQRFELENSYGIKVDLSSLAIVSSIISIIGILFSASRTMDPIKEHTHNYLAIVAFMPNFLFRMTSWLLIIMMLDLFSFVVFIGILAVNLITLILVQDQLSTEPLKQSLLSLIFPVYELPSVKNDPSKELKFLHWLTLTGNTFLIIMIGILYALYNFEVYNPWCSLSRIHIKFPESFLGGIACIAVMLYGAATLTPTVCFLFKSSR